MKPTMALDVALPSMALGARMLATVALQGSVAHLREFSVNLFLAINSSFLWERHAINRQLTDI